jgi:predicted nucleic acid-binding protein
VGRVGENVTRAFVDTNVLIRHLTGDPPEQAARATAALASAEALLLTEVVVAECVFVLESFYGLDRPRVAEALRAAVAMESTRLADPAGVLRALEVYELYGVHFAEAHLIASSEVAGTAVLSLDRDIDRVPGGRRLEP